MTSATTAGVQTVTTDESLVSFVVNPVVVHGETASTTVVVSSILSIYLQPHRNNKNSNSNINTDLDTELLIITIGIEGVIGYRIPVWGGVIPSKHQLSSYIPGPQQSVSLIPRYVAAVDQLVQPY